jgi:hypothetical protein
VLCIPLNVTAASAGAAEAHVEKLSLPELIPLLQRQLSLYPEIDYELEVEVTGGEPPVVGGVALRRSGSGSAARLHVQLDSTCRGLNGPSFGA